MRLRDFYELIIERHRQASTIITSNREPEILTVMADPLLAQSAMTDCSRLLTNSSWKAKLSATPKTHNP